MKRGLNPLAFLILTIVIVAGVIAAFFVRLALPETMQFRDVIAWGIMIVICAGGGIFTGKKFGNRR